MTPAQCDRDRYPWRRGGSRQRDVRGPAGPGVRAGTPPGGLRGRLNRLDFRAPAGGGEGVDRGAGQGLGARGGGGAGRRGDGGARGEVGPPAARLRGRPSRLDFELSGWKGMDQGRAGAARTVSSGGAHSARDPRAAGQTCPHSVQEGDNPPTPIPIPNHPARLSRRLRGLAVLLEMHGLWRGAGQRGPLPRALGGPGFAMEQAPPMGRPTPGCGQGWGPVSQDGLESLRSQRGWPPPPGRHVWALGAAVQPELGLWRGGCTQSPLSGRQEPLLTRHTTEATRAPTLGRLCAAERSGSGSLSKGRQPITPGATRWAAPGDTGRGWWADAAGRRGPEKGRGVTGWVCPGRGGL